MLRSMFSGVTGLRAHQTMMDVTANNLANVNTTGYKSSRATFQDHLYQTVRGATAGTATSGGIDPSQLGLGVTVSSFEGNFAQGAMMLTNRSTDVAIQGEGMFVVEDAAGANYYTRAGAFSWDNEGNLVNPNGYRVVGWNGAATPGTTPIVTTDPTATGAITVDPDELATVREISIGADGVIAGRDDAGDVVYLGVIAMANFANLNGLDRVGETMFGATVASGAAQIGTARTGALGIMTSGTLEMSNVDVAQEFTQLIMAQRGFQANARTITTSDEMLQELVNIKR